MARQTSIESFMDIKPSRKRLLYDAIIQILRANTGGLTDSEICNLIPDFLHSMEPRVRRNELFNKGIIVQEGVRKCSITNKNVIVWKLREPIR
jgi:hypothetical protein